VFWATSAGKIGGATRTGADIGRWSRWPPSTLYYFRVRATSTLRDVAELVGVSSKTVSNVVNGHPAVSEATRKRVLAAIEQLDYRPNLNARGLKSGTSGVITLIIPDLRNAYFAELANSVMEAAKVHGVFVLIEQIGYDRETEIESLRGPRSRLVDGILYSAMTLTEEDADLLTTRTPTVLLGEQIFNGPIDHVTMRNVEAVEASTTLLLSKGRRRIVALGAQQQTSLGSSWLRLQGYEQALTKAGIAIDPDLVVDTKGWHRADGAAAINSVIDKGTNFDGVVAFSDTLALGAMRALQESGRRIPHDVAIIGFDDIDETRYSLPTLSTVDAGRDTIATTAVEMLLHRINSKDAPEPPHETFVDFRLIERESTPR
jgi:DNA-binding LacI/PurR family transcriptional regulator